MSSNPQHRVQRNRVWTVHAPACHTDSLGALHALRSSGRGALAESVTVQCTANLKPAKRSRAVVLRCAHCRELQRRRCCTQWPLPGSRQRPSCPRTGRARCWQRWSDAQPSCLPCISIAHCQPCMQLKSAPGPFPNEMAGTQMQGTEDDRRLIRPMHQLQHPYHILGEKPSHHGCPMALQCHASNCRVPPYHSSK